MAALPKQNKAGCSQSAEGSYGLCWSVGSVTGLVGLYMQMHFVSEDLQVNSSILLNTPWNAADM